MRAIVIFFLLIFPSILLKGQSVDTLYLSKTKDKVINKKEAIYYRIVSYSDTSKVEGIEKTYYISGKKEAENRFTEERTEFFTRIKYYGLSTKWYENGQMKMQSSFVAGKKEGKETQWYENGQVYNVSHFTNGDRKGEAITYYEDNRIKRKEIFSDDLLIEGKCYTKAGTDTTYFPMSEIPIFPGGETALIQFIQKNIKYNKKALRQGIQGLVIVQFNVNTSGKIVDPRVVKKLSPELDAESLRVVNLMPDNWQPGREEGKPVNFTFTLPVRFAF